MSSPFIGQIMVFPGNYAPGGWAVCDGSLLAAADYPELFEVIGTTYGGDGQTFALPDLRGRVPIAVGQGRGLPSYSLGQKAGQETVTLTIAQLPPHSHRVMAADTPGDSDTPANTTVLSALGGQAAAGEYATPAYAPPRTQTALNAASVGSAGGSRPHNNLQPYLAITFCIALGGTMPA